MNLHIEYRIHVQGTNEDPVGVNLCRYVTDDLFVLYPDIVPGANGTTTPKICSGLETLKTGCIVQVLCPM